MTIAETNINTKNNIKIVSVIVPTFNRASYIKECLDSLLSQTLPPLEIIVVDDGSEDETPNILNSYGRKIQYIHKENGGKASAVNLALTLAKGEFIWLFDDDDVALNTAIETRLKILARNPGCGFVYSPHYIGSNRDNGSILKTNIQKIPLHDANHLFIQLMKGCYFHLNSCLVKKEAYDKIGGFDTELLRGQDYDMQIRLARHFKAVFSPEPSFIFRQHDGVRGGKKIRHTDTNRDRIFRTYDHMIGEKIRATVNLNEFLSEPISISDNKDFLRRALLTRMVVMGSKGCIREMFEDLAAAIKSLGPHEQFNADETALIASTITTGYAYSSITDDLSGFFQCLNSLKITSAGRQSKKLLAHGFYKLAKSYPDSIKNRIYKLLLAISVFIK